MSNRLELNMLSLSNLLNVYALFPSAGLLVMRSVACHMRRHQRRAMAPVMGRLTPSRVMMVVHGSGFELGGSKQPPAV